MAVAFGLEVVQRSIAACLAEERHLPLVLEGPAGAGKSSLMAACAQSTRVLLPHLKLFCHFVGAAPGSTDLVCLLRRLWLELAPDQVMPPTEESLVRGAYDLLAHAGRQGGAVIFIDALNQLDRDAEWAPMQWLPAQLPPGVRCVVSAIDGTRFHELLLQRKPQPLRLQVGDLDRVACQRVVCKVLGDSVEVLHSERILDCLLGKRGAGNPLWLVSACGELRAVAEANRESTDAAVQAAIRGFPDDLLGLFEEILARVEKEHDPVRTRATLCLLECSRHGLSPGELRALLADEAACCMASSAGASAEQAAIVAPAQVGSPLGPDPDPGRHAAVDQLKEKLHASAKAAMHENHLQASTAMASPPTASAGDGGGSSARAGSEAPLLAFDIWNPIYESLKPFLRPCGCSTAEGRLDFFHRAVSKAVRLRYFAKGEGASGHAREEDVLVFWHGRLADFFERCPHASRRAEELPYHLERMLDNSRLLRSIVQWDVFSRLASAANGFELLRFCRAAGGTGAVASALREQLDVWARQGLTEAELLDRQCIVAEFLTKAGQSHHAVAILEETPPGAAIPHAADAVAAARARRLGLLADAVLAGACFGQCSHDSLQRVPFLLQTAVVLWRSTAPEMRDDAALAQALSNLCFHHGQEGQLDEAEAAGREAMAIFGRLRHPRLGQAEQHMAHVLKAKGLKRQAYDMYRQSVATFERTGVAKFDTEHACSLSSVAGMFLEGTPSWAAAVAWQKAAVVSCEAFTGRDHVEAQFYRRALVQYLIFAREVEQARRVQAGIEVEVTAADLEAMRALPQ